MLFKDDVLEENDRSRSASLSVNLTFTAPTLPSQKGPFVHNPPPITPPPARILPIHIHKVIHTSLSDRPPIAFLNPVKTVTQHKKVTFAELNKQTELQQTIIFHYWFFYRFISVDLWIVYFIKKITITVSQSPRGQHQIACLAWLAAQNKKSIICNRDEQKILIWASDNRKCLAFLLDGWLMDWYGVKIVFNFQLIA